jgi:hypothetical protein
VFRVEDLGGSGEKGRDAGRGWLRAEGLRLKVKRSFRVTEFR